jgi:hypothetical protein
MSAKDIKKMTNKNEMTKTKKKKKGNIKTKEK